MPEKPATPESLKVLLQTSIPAAETIVVRLAADGIEAEIIDQPSTLALMLACGTYRVRIGVPSAQLDAARECMHAWEPSARANVKELSRTIYRQALISLVPGLIVFLVNLWIVGEPSLLMVVPSFVVAFLAFLALAFFERSRAGGG